MNSAESRSFRYALGLFLCLAVLAIVGTLIQSAVNEAVTLERFRRLAEASVQRIHDRIELYQYGLRGARGAVIGAGYETITRERFTDYHKSRDVDGEFPGARGFGLIRRVPRASEAQFVAAARVDGMTDFSIRELAPHSGERYVIQYIEPVERNRQAVGLDIGSEANRREAADRAMRTGEVALTGPITLVQAVGRETQSFLILLPVYRPGMPLRTVEEREAAAFAWTYAPLVIEEVLEGVNLGGEVALTLYDRPAGGGTPTLFFGEEQEEGDDVVKTHFEIAAAIASAVEEQRAATSEIARNVQEAARGTQEVTSNIAGVKQASMDAGAAAAQVLTAAGGLAEQSETLNEEVRAFISGVKAA